MAKSKIVVIGAGVMGQGLAEAIATNGHDVTLVDRTTKLAEKGIKVSQRYASPPPGTGAPFSRVVNVTQKRCMLDCELLEFSRLSQTTSVRPSPLTSPNFSAAAPSKPFSVPEPTVPAQTP